MIRKYKPIYKPNQIIYGTGDVVIVSGWTPRSYVEKQLTPDQFAAIGQLYSATRGINVLVHNLLANPSISQLIIMNGTKEDKNSGACLCLIDFLSNGFEDGITETGKKCWMIRSSVKGYIDSHIPDAVLTAFRQSLVYQEVGSIADLHNAIKEIIPTPPRAEPLIFELKSSLPTILPGARYGHRVEGKTIAETWVKILHRIKSTGTIRPTGYDGFWQELIDLVAVVEDEPEGFFFPTPNYLPVNSDFIQDYIPQVLFDSPYTEGVKYTYGQRIRSWFGVDQVEQVVKKLVDEIDAASAVISLWDVEDHEKGGSPCLNHIWLRVVNQELSLTATFRSNDMFGAWVANAMGLRALQRLICNRINQESNHNLRLGALITISQSAHIYDDTWESVEAIVNQHYLGKKSVSFADPCGNFLIEIDNKDIIISQTNPGDGEIVKVYQGQHPLKLIRDITRNSPALSPDHSGYLGIELQKAYHAIINGLAYTQDD